MHDCSFDHFSITVFSALFTRIKIYAMWFSDKVFYVISKWKLMNLNNREHYAFFMLISIDSLSETLPISKEQLLELLRYHLPIMDMLLSLLSNLMMQNMGGKEMQVNCDSVLHKFYWKKSRYFWILFRVGRQWSIKNWYFEEWFNNNLKK